MRTRQRTTDGRLAEPSGLNSQRAREHLTGLLQRQGIHCDAVLEGIRATPRHLFIDEALTTRAYHNTALPIGHRQTISQPYAVARMVQLLLESGTVGKVLEIGTGSGYQTAILARIARQVYSMERIADLLARARRRLHALDLHNVHTRHADGSGGWLAYAPYDGIIVSAAAVEVPAELPRQLADGGRLVIPIGSARHQSLLCIERHGERFRQRDLGEVHFVPLCDGMQ